MRDWRMMLLGFGVAALDLPSLIEGEFHPRWSIIAIGCAIAGRIDVMALPEGVRWLLLFLPGLGAASLFGSPMPLAGVMELLFMCFLILAFVVAASLESLDDVMTGLGWGLAISSALTIGQKLGWQPVAHGNEVPSGLFFNSEVMGEFAALVAVWAVLRPRYGIAIVAVIPVLLTGSRIGLCTLVLAPLLAMLSWRRVWVFLPPIVLTLAAAAAAVLFFKQFDSQHRLILWGAGLLHFTWLGRGLGFVDAAFPYEEFLHSDALQAMVELGALGLAFAILPILILRHPRGNLAERSLFIAACLETLVSFPLHFPAQGFVAAMAAGFCAGRSPVLCGDRAHGDLRDDGRDEGADDAGRRTEGAGGPGGLLVPVRSALARVVSLYPSATRSHSGAA